jgi:hypothetical protein
VTGSPTLEETPTSAPAAPPSRRPVCGAALLPVIFAAIFIGKGHGHASSGKN